MKPDQERVKNLLSDTVTLLCKNGLTFQQELKVEGLIAITVDKNEFFVIHIDETTAGENAKTAGDSAADESESAAYHSEDSLDTGSQSPSRKRQRNSVERQNEHFHKTPQKASGQFSSPRPSPSHARRSTDRHRTNASSRLSNERHSTQGVEDTPDESRIPKLEDIKIKIEDEDVLILDEDDQQDPGRPDPSQRVPPTGHDDAEAMREGYSNMSMDSLQGEYPPYSQMSGNEGPPSKRRATSVDGSGTDYYGEGGGDSNSNDSAFITGIVQNIFKQEPQSASWSEASASLGADPALQTGGAGDGQLPGCSSWQASPGGQYQQPSDMKRTARKTRAQIQREYRERKKAREGTAYLVKERMRVKKYYVPASKMPPAELRKRRKQNRLKMKKYREWQKLVEREVARMQQQAVDIKTELENT